MFSRGKFWRWIALGGFYGLFILYVTIFSLEGAHAHYDKEGYTASLFVSGTLAYAMVVIVANFKLAFSTHTHTIWSTLVILLSIASFFVVFAIESSFEWIPSLFGSFFYAMRIPDFYVLAFFFFLSTLTFEALFHHWNRYYLR